MRKSKAIKRAVATKNDLHSNLLRIKNAIADTKDGFTGRAHELVNNLIEEVQDRTSDYHETAEDYITAQPFKAVGIALLAGFFLAKVC